MTRIGLDDIYSFNKTCAPTRFDSTIQHLEKKSLQGMRGSIILYKRKEECCGCTACYAICPKEAISMVEDEEGFEYPQIDESKWWQVLHGGICAEEHIVR